MKAHAYSKGQLAQMIRPTLVVSVKKRIEPAGFYIEDEELVQARLEEYYALSCSNDLGVAMDKLTVEWSTRRPPELQAA